MESFAAIVHTLLARIRVIQNRRDRREWPPSGSAGATSTTRYRVAPTAWGVDPEESPSAGSPRGSETGQARPVPAGSGSTPRSATRRLELTAYGLPVPRGLPAI